MLEEIGVTVNIGALPEVKAHRSAEATLDTYRRIRRFLLWRRYARALENVSITRATAEQAVMNEIIKQMSAAPNGR